MAGRFEIDGTDVTVTFEYKAPIDLVTSIVYAVAENLWVEELDENEEVINPFSEATAQAKLNVVDQHVVDVLVDMANSFKSVRAQELARETEANNKYKLED